MNVTGVIMLVDNFNFLSSSQMKVDINFMNNVRTGKGVKNYLDMYAEDEFMFRNYFFKGELGQVKYKVVTGKILDYKA